MRLLFFLLTAFLLAAPAHAAPQAKFALVIANFDYDGDGKTDASPQGVTRARERGYAGDLANPWFDAVRVGEALKAAGFAVETAQNADRAAMLGAIARLRARANAAGPASASVIYYAGHGVQINGRACLVAPRTQLGNIKVENAEDRDRIGFALGPSLMEILAGARQPTAPGYELLLIDACRDDPWEALARAEFAKAGRDYAGERAYGALMPPSPRVVIAFSAQGGKFAQDGFSAASSPFANAVSRRARERGAAIDQLLQGVMGEVAASSGARQIPAILGRFGDATALAE